MQIAIWQSRQAERIQHKVMCQMTSCQMLSMAFGGNFMDSPRKQMLSSSVKIWFLLHVIFDVFLKWNLSSCCSHPNLITSFQGWGDVKVPDVLRRNDPSQMHLPLFLALAVSPLMLLAPVQWHTKDFNRSALVGVCHKSSVIKFNNICNIDMAVPGK